MTPRTIEEHFNGWRINEAQKKMIIQSNREQASSQVFKESGLADRIKYGTRLGKENPEDFYKTAIDHAKNMADQRHNRQRSASPLSCLDRSDAKDVLQDRPEVGLKFVNEDAVRKQVSVQQHKKNKSELTRLMDQNRNAKINS